jgi:NDP-sugar pyrophosphorylase family protein
MPGHPLRCGIVLAGGDGQRLQPFIRRFMGSDLPKQFVNLIGTRSMLEHTYSRAKRLIPPERIFTVIAQNHLKHQEVLIQVNARPARTIVLQPRNRETGPGILLHLISLSAPSLYYSFQRISRALDTRNEAATIEKIYEDMKALNFSKDLMGDIDLHSRNQLSVISMKGVFWSDWGSRERIIAVLRMLRGGGRSQDRFFPDEDLEYMPSSADNRLQAVL